MKKIIKMKTQREKVIANYYTPHKHQDLIDIYNWVAPDILIIDESETPWGGVYSGLEGVGHYLMQVTSNILSEITVQEVFTCGDTVFVYGRTKGNVQRTAVTFDLPIIHQFTFNKEHKITKVMCYTDSNAMKTALDLKQDQTAIRQAA